MRYFWNSLNDGHYSTCPIHKEYVEILALTQKIPLGHFLIKECVWLNCTEKSFSIISKVTNIGIFTFSVFYINKKSIKGSLYQFSMQVVYL